MVTFLPASDVAAVAPSVVTNASTAVTTATSQIGFNKSRHLDQRMVERVIAKRDLQEAKKFGVKSRGQGGRTRYEHQGRAGITPRRARSRRDARRGDTERTRLRHAESTGTAGSSTTKEAARLA